MLERAVNCDGIVNVTAKVAWRESAGCWFGDDENQGPYLDCRLVNARKGAAGF